MSEGRSGGRALSSIESLGTPLAFKVSGPSEQSADAGECAELRVHCEVRALEGMQKEALVHDGPSGPVWRNSRRPYSARKADSYSNGPLSASTCPAGACGSRFFGGPCTISCPER